MKVGYIGLGTQGKYLAVNLVEAGHDVMVHDLRREPLDLLSRHGAKIGHSAAEIGAHAEVVEICVLNDAQVEEVVAGPAGVLTRAASGTIVAIHSTIRPAMVMRLAELAAARGVELIDVPVSGSERGARAKTMSYMAGGSASAFEKCKPLFETSGSKITHCGPLGTGMRAKLAHQLIFCVNILAASEGMRLGVTAGVRAEILQKVIHEGVGQSFIADNWTTLAMPSSSRSTLYKDLQLCLEFAHDIGVPIPGAALAQQLIDHIVPTE